jgi:RNA polymerase sigma-70 factor (ECF subfamily)
MTETSLSLLDSLRLHPDQEAWRRLVDLYTPLIRGWLRRQGMADQDTEDVVQEVLAVVFRKLPEFDRQPHTGAFRSWLRTITVNCLRQSWRRRGRQPLGAGGTDFGQFLDQLADPGSGLSRLWDEEHDRYITQRLLEAIRPSFEPKTWRAFQRVALDGIRPDDVAAELGLTVNAVFIAKSRVLTRLRQEGKGLIE